MKLFNVYARSLTPPYAERLMETGLTEENAESFVKIAVMRRGVEEECFYAREAELAEIGAKK